MGSVDVSDGFWEFIDAFGLSNTSVIIRHPMYQQIKQATTNNFKFRISSSTVGATATDAASSARYLEFDDIQALFVGVIGKLEEYMYHCGVRRDQWSTAQTVDYYVVAQRLDRIKAAVEAIENVNDIDWISANLDTFSF